MNHVLRNGGIFHDEIRGQFWISDLHTIGNCVQVVVTAPPLTAPVDMSKITLTLRADGDALYRLPHAGERYGTITAEQLDCTASLLLKEHIKKYYELNDYQFIYTLE